MGNFTRIYNDRKQQATITESVKNTETLLNSLTSRLELVEKDLRVGAQVHINMVEKKKVITNYILDMAVAPAMFIPFAGPLVAASCNIGKCLVDSVNKPLNIQTSAMVISASLDSIYSLPFKPTYVKDKDNGVLSSFQDLLKEIKTNKEISINVKSKNGSTQKIIIADKSQGALASDAVLENGLKLTQPDSFRSDSNYESSPMKDSCQNVIQIREKFFQHYQPLLVRNLTQTMKFLLNDSNRHLLLPLVFWKMCSDQDIKGHGTLILNSLDLKEGKNLDSWVPVSRAQSLLVSDGGHLSNIAKNVYKSEFMNEAKKKFDFDSYNGMTQVEITPIYLEKIRLLSYRNRYIDSLYSLINCEFLNTLLKYAKEMPEMHSKQFGELFYKTKIDRIEDCTSVNSIRPSKDIAHQYRRKMIYSSYCFHQILIQHLGTYFLASLPSIGTSEIEKEKKVALAVVDAVSTAWWASTKAFAVNKKVVLNQCSSLQEHLLSKQIIFNMFHIQNYFSLSRIMFNNIALSDDPRNKKDIVDCLRRHLENILKYIYSLSPYDMMPIGDAQRQKIDKDGFNIVIKNTVAGLYKRLIFLDMSQYYDTAYKEFNDYKISNKTEVEDISTKYDKFIGDEINKKVLPTEANEKNSVHLKNKFHNYLTKEKPLKEISDQDLADEVANLRMLMTLSAKEEIDGFDQYQFNRNVCKVLEKMLKYMGSNNNSLMKSKV